MWSWHAQGTEWCPGLEDTGLRRHEVLNLISSEKSHSGRTGMSEDWILEPGSKRSQLALFSHW